MRAQLENHHKQGTPQVEDMIKAHRKWVDDFGLYREMAFEEKQWMDEKPGEWHTQRIGNLFWKIESFKALLWIISVFDDMPPIGEVGDIKELYNLSQYPKNPRDFINAGLLREPEQIQAETQVYTYLEWRTRTEYMRRTGVKPPEGDSYQNIIQRSLSGIPKGPTILEHNGSDILINGKPFADIEDLNPVAPSVAERLKALRWSQDKSEWPQ